MNILDKYALDNYSSIDINSYKKKYENNSSAFRIPKDSEITEDINPTKREKELERLKSVCKDFEALMLNEMFKSMRNTVNKTKLVDGGMAEDIFEDMLYDEYAKEFSKSEKIGLSQMLYKHMERYI